MASQPTSFLNALLSGASAGVVVDVALFPIDTLKTRLQSPQGFFKAGWFWTKTPTRQNPEFRQGIYSGLSAAALGSAPGGKI
eukprot:826838-Amorphochlora_amoeboformis.AAC.1